MGEGEKRSRIGFPAENESVKVKGGGFAGSRKDRGLFRRKGGEEKISQRRGEKGGGKF